jgi:hypothetical protein
LPYRRDKMAKIGQPPSKGTATADGPNMNPPPYAEGEPKLKKYGPGVDGALGTTEHNGSIDNVIRTQAAKVGKVYGW